MGKIMGRLAYLGFGLYRPIDKYLVGQAGAVLVNGYFGQSLIRDTYKLPATVITHGFELAETGVTTAVQVRQRYKLGDRPIILTVNHLHPRKRIDLLLKAMTAILEECPQVVALIVGQGPEGNALKVLATTLGLDETQVIFSGFVAEAELAAYYQAAQVYAHMGRDETFGLAVLEASANGVPVVAANEGGPREILEEGVTGFLVEAQPSQFAAQLSWLLQNPSAAQEMGAQGAKAAHARYTWQQGAQDFRQAVAKARG
jgi:phosphatidylinositol alpha-1,6-mannosyltransferase